MRVLKQGLSDSEFLKFGLIWAIPAGIALSERLSKLMDEACLKK